MEDELDSDLYDRVSYLNLMDKIDTRKKTSKVGKFRDDSDAPSPRLDASEAMSAPPDPDIKRYWDSSLDITDLSGHDFTIFKQLQGMLGIENISFETLARFNVRVQTDTYGQPAILFPRYRGMTSRLRIPMGLKLIRKVGDRMEKENYPLPDETSVRQKFNGVFGLHMATLSDRSVVITTNERDALAIYEATKALVFALPHGEILDPLVLPYLEEFDKIYLWFPVQHVSYAKDWGSALNTLKCLLVKNEERPIELVRNGDHRLIRNSLSNSVVRMRERGFRSMTDLDMREGIRSDLLNSTNRVVGFGQWKRFAVLNKYLGGLRPGEMTVLTGGTGNGKTTFLCEYSLDLFTQGVRTLFCSFEMPEKKILHWMLVQYAGYDDLVFFLFPSHLRSLARTNSYKNGIKLPLHRVEYSNSINSWLDRFERSSSALTMLDSEEFMEKSINEIVRAIRIHVENSGIQHVVIDNLQFLINQGMMADEKSSGLDRFHLQDRFVGYMRQLATQNQIHITMVVHPRKTDGDTEIDVQHFGGSARVTQEADNVIAIQRKRDDRDRSKFRKFLYILKNRYYGRRVESDQLEMVFNPSTYSHTVVEFPK
ncbi:SF4 helicase domain-containing protein [Caenorhabditis elegans]|uniref:SF4 helicase domain-containing protein n=1 Tax=Caenorhabditis elegans TaxID=6239 RepID=Q5WRT0_CAEEL|nr:SF4 helicase domain-containing protein [Caenorhabditis elegans]CCD68071.2 SF4 helicase domain-containing protein [Caenorhabditis elegans]|eukprot:NP_508973.3 TWiNKle mtDNA helicase homolog [Caenorhabditis elegans]